MEVFSQVGELVGGFGALFALIYLGVQIRQSNVLARAQSRQTLIDTWSAGNWDLARDPDLLRVFGAALSRWPEISDRDKTAFDIAMTWFLANLQNGLLLMEAGLLDAEVLDQTAGYMVASAASEGGGRWWRETMLVPPTVRVYVECRLAADEADLPSIDKVVPYWMSMADDE